MSELTIEQKSISDQSTEFILKHDGKETSRVRVSHLNEQQLIKIRKDQIQELEDILSGKIENTFGYPVTREFINEAKKLFEME